MSACWPIQIPPTPKSILIALADNANDQGVCWPAIETISMRTCFSKTAVIEAIKWLEAHGLVAADRSNGRKTTYQVIPNGKAPQLFDAGGKPTGRRTGAAAGPVRDANRSNPKPAREPDGSGKQTGAAPDEKRSGSRTQPVREPDTNRQEPSGTDLSLSHASDDDGSGIAPDVVGTFEGHGNGAFDPTAGKPNAAGELAVALRSLGYRTTSLDPDLLSAVLDGVTVEQATELAALNPPDPSYGCSPNYLLKIARRQRAEAAQCASLATTTVPRGTAHATNRPGHRGSASERVAQRIREAEQRDAAAAAEAHVVAADG